MDPFFEDIEKQLYLNFSGTYEVNMVEKLNDPSWIASEEDYLPPRFLPKRTGGKRVIQEPKSYLKEAQRRVMQILARFGYGPSPFAHGFVNRRSRKTNAIPHVGNSRMLKIDLKDFFGSCKPEMVIAALNTREVPAWVLRVVSRLCFLGGGLPQGAPSSPMLSNITARELDFRLSGLCLQFRRSGGVQQRHEPIAYTRYADDMTFSSRYDKLNQLLYPVKRIVKDCGFSIKPSKTRYFTRPKRLETCGVVVSDKKINAKRHQRRYWRGRLHKMSEDIRQGRVPPGMFLKSNGSLHSLSKKKLRQIMGNISAIVDISPQDREALMTKFGELRRLCEQGDTSR